MTRGVALSAAEADPACLRLGHDLATLRPTLHNGPGWRIGLWVQGCSLLCTHNCLSPHLLLAAGGHVVPVEEVAAAIDETVALSDVAVEGVTVLGGEPTDQAAGVARLLERVRASGLSTMLYSGRTLAQLKRSGDPVIIRLLGTVDVLADGPFRDRLYDETLAWRGSTNQQLHCLSARYTPADLAAAFARQRKAFSVRLAPGGRISVSGLQARAGASAIERLIGAGRLDDDESPVEKSGNG